MNIREPQTELPRDGIGRVLSGASDSWDDGLAGSIISDEFFEAPAPATGTEAYFKDGGIWKLATAYFKENGIWKVATPSIKDTGAWN